jgi:predicted aspartyl protease
MENKAFKEGGDALLLMAKRPHNPCRTRRAGKHRLLLGGRDGVTYCALLCVVVLLSIAALPASAESSHPVTVSMRPYKGDRPIVAVKLNGAGPYDFMVDTGATTTVMDTALFDQLGLRAEGSSRITSSAGATNQVRSAVKEITLDCLSAQNITVVGMKFPLKGSDYRTVRGILGENFLRHFDILFDNQNRTMTLDAADSLADSLSGERIPIIFPPLARDGENRYRPMISVTVQTFGHAIVLLDSGATDLILLQWGNQSNGFADTRLTTVNGWYTCESTVGGVHLGKGPVNYLPMVHCQGATVKLKDCDGILPTAIFKQIFISHAGSYAIISPAKRTSVPAELGRLSPLGRPPSAVHE